MITPTVSETLAPAATGGTIADGTYTETSITIYGIVNFPAGTLEMEKQQGTLTVNGTTVQTVTTTVSTMEVKRSTDTFTLSGTTAIDTSTCPAADAGPPKPTSYSATPTTFSFYVDVPPAGTIIPNGATYEITFTKQ